MLFRSFIPPRTLVEDFYIWYVAAGAGAVQIDGQWLHFIAGDLLTILPGEHYQMETTDAAHPSQVYFTHVWPFGTRSPSRLRALAEGWPRQTARRDCREMHGWFQTLLDLWTLKPAGYPLRAKATMLQIMAAALVNSAGSASAADGKSQAMVLAAQEYVLQHYPEALTPEAIAEHVGLSASYLYSLFQRVLGRSPMHYVAEVRLREAATMLAHGAPVSATAAAVGYNSIHYFSRAFRKHFGQPPSRFVEPFRRK